MLNRTIFVLSERGYQNFCTRWGLKEKLANDPPEQEGTFLIGKVVDSKKKPWDEGNFMAARPEKGTPRKNLKWQPHHYDKDIWSENYSWKFRLMQSFQVFDKEGVVRGEFKDGEEVYIELGWSQNNALNDLLKGRKDIPIIPVKVGKNIMFQELGGEPPAGAEQTKPEEAEQLAEYGNKDDLPF